MDIKLRCIDFDRKMLVLKILYQSIGTNSICSIKMRNRSDTAFHTPD